MTVLDDEQIKQLVLARNAHLRLVRDGDGVTVVDVDRIGDGDRLADTFDATDTAVLAEATMRQLVEKYPTEPHQVTFSPEDERTFKAQVVRWAAATNTLKALEAAGA